MNRIFIDTGALIARYIQRDQYHREALGIWNTLIGSSLFLSSYILDELLTYVGRIAGNRFIAEKVRAIYSSSSFSILRPDVNDEVEALRLFEHFHDQNMSYTDCISFILMKRHGLKDVFSFDRHFDTAGFERLP